MKLVNLALRKFHVKQTKTTRIIDRVNATRIGNYPVIITRHRPTAGGIENAVYQVNDADNCSTIKRIKIYGNRGISINSSAGVNKKRSSVVSFPRAIFYIFPHMENCVAPRLPNRETFHVLSPAAGGDLPRYVAAPATTPDGDAILAFALRTSDTVFPKTPLKIGSSRSLV